MISRGDLTAWEEEGDGVSGGKGLIVVEGRVVGGGELVAGTRDAAASTGSRAAALLALLGVAVLVQVQLEGSDVVVEAERGHREQDVLAVDRLALLLQTRSDGEGVSVGETREARGLTW